MSVYGGEDLFERLNGLFLEWRVWGKDRELNLKCVNDIYSLSLDFIVKAVEKRYRVYGKAYSKYCPREYKDRLSGNKALLLVLAARNNGFDPLVRQLTGREESALLKELEARKNSPAKIDRDIANRIRDYLVRLHSGYVRKAVEAFKGYGLEEDDLFQEGMMGFLRAMDNFRCQPGKRLRSFSSWWVWGAMLRALISRGYIVRVPVKIAECIARIRDLEAGDWQSRSALRGREDRSSSGEFVRAY